MSAAPGRPKQARAPSGGSEPRAAGSVGVTSGAPVVLVLASGRGERFRASGGQVHKLQALLAGKPVLERTLNAVRASGLDWHLEDAGHPGMGDSIAAAVRATAHAGGWLVLPGDLPLIAPESLRTVAAALAGAAVVRPSHGGVRGHPVGFSAACRDALLALSGEAGASAIVQARQRAGQVLELPLADAGCVTDIDTLDDLARAERAWISRAPT
jgi:molybdenum cofactor cytidylyltransferase